MPRLQNVKTVDFSKKFNKIINQIQALYRIDADLQEIDNDLNRMEHQQCKHFGDYHKVCILYRKCFDSNDRRSFALDSKKYTKFDIHQRLIDLADKHVAHSEFDQYDEVHLSFIIDNNSNKAINIKVDINFYEPLNCLDYLKILELLLIIRSDIYLNITKLQDNSIQEYNRLRMLV